METPAAADFAPRLFRVDSAPGVLQKTHVGKDGKDGTIAPRPTLTHEPPATPKQTMSRSYSKYAHTSRSSISDGSPSRANSSANLSEWSSPLSPWSSPPTTPSQTPRMPMSPAGSSYFFRNASEPDLFARSEPKLLFPEGAHVDRQTLEDPFERDPILRPLGPLMAPPKLPPSPMRSHVNFGLDDDQSSFAAEAGTAVKRRRPFRRQASDFLQSHYRITHNQDVVLATPPTDTEKLSYLKTHRYLLCSLGVVGFMSSAASLWLFSLSAVYFAWFTAILAVVQLDLAIFYILGVCGKNFSVEEHEKAKAGNLLTSASPSIDIYLPCCREGLDVLENTYKFVRRLRYPGEVLVHVLDDGAMPEVKALAERYGFNYIVREDRPFLKKAGNLRHAFRKTQGDFYVIFDADFCPEPNFLVELMPHMLADPKIAILQTPQFFRELGHRQTWIERGAGATQEIFYRFIQTTRNTWGGAVCVGSNAIYRREALDEWGGVADVSSSEDIQTGYLAMSRGWKVRYVPLCLACGICPDSPKAFFAQQYRWCEGSASLVLSMAFWRSGLTKVQKMCFLNGMLYYTTTAMSTFIYPLPSILLLFIRTDLLKYYNLFFALPAIIFELIIFRYWARINYSLSVQHVLAIQRWAFISAIFDRIVGHTLAWVPSGTGKSHATRRFVTMKTLAIGWTTATQTAIITGTTLGLLAGIAWWNFFPLLLLSAYNLFLDLPFLLS